MVEEQWRNPRVITLFDSTTTALQTVEVCSSGKTSSKANALPKEPTFHHANALKAPPSLIPYYIGSCIIAQQLESNFRKPSSLSFLADL